MTEEPQKPLERFREFAKQIISVPKDEIDRREIEYRKARKAARKARA